MIRKTSTFIIEFRIFIRYFIFHSGLLSAPAYNILLILYTKVYLSELNSHRQPTWLTTDKNRYWWRRYFPAHPAHPKLHYVYRIQEFYQSLFSPFAQ